MSKFTLSLSGGGKLSVPFQVGALFALKDCDLVPRVSLVTSSGTGNIVAASMMQTIFNRKKVNIEDGDEKAVPIESEETWMNNLFTNYIYPNHPLRVWTSTMFKPWTWCCESSTQSILSRNIERAIEISPTLSQDIVSDDGKVPLFALNAFTSNYDEAVQLCYVSQDQVGYGVDDRSIEFNSICTVLNNSSLSKFLANSTSWFNYQPGRNKPWANCVLTDPYAQTAVKHIEPLAKQKIIIDGYTNGPVFNRQSPAVRQVAQQQLPRSNVVSCFDHALLSHESSTVSHKVSELLNGFDENHVTEHMFHTLVSWGYIQTLRKFSPNTKRTFRSSVNIDDELVRLLLPPVAKKE